MKTIAIYHKDCSDGTAAAAVVLRKFPGARVFPLNHGFEPSELEAIIKVVKKGDQIFTVDCVLGVREFLDLGFPVTSIDHHVSGESEYSELAEKNKSFTFIFNNKKSGASLTWDYLFPKEKKPELIKLVEDRDLWRFRYGQKTTNIGNSLHFFVNQPEKVVKLFDGDLKVLEKEGSVISRYSKMSIEHAVEKIDPIIIKIKKYKVTFYNITTHKSDCGNILTKKIGKAVGLFTIDGDAVTVSFRSLDGQKPSALDLAKALGSGGHNNASGAKIKLSDFIKSIVS